MSLLQLPPEILIHIFDYFGSSYSRSDLLRPIVCKQWSKFAHTACFRDSYVTQKTLRRLMSSPYVELSLPLVEDSVEILDLDLKGFEDWDSIPLSQHDSQVENVPNVSTWNGAHGRAVRAAWTTKLNNDLLHLATIIRSCASYVSKPLVNCLRYIVFYNAATTFLYPQYAPSYHPAT